MAVLAAGLALASGLAAASPAGAAGRSASSSPPLAYDLVAADGAVTSFGHAPNFGGAEHLHLNAPIVGMAPTPDGLGYWLVASDGGVFTYGDAKFDGSLGGTKHTAAHDVIALVPTPDGGGYWLCDASGVVTAFGDAPKLPSLRPAAAHTPIVGFAVLHDEKGAWVVNAKGVVFHLGAAHLYGSMANTALPAPIVAMAATPNGRGYWLTDSAGDAFAFGNAAPGAAPPVEMQGTVVSIAAAPTGGGYWAATTTGYVIADGVPSKGGLVKRTGTARIVGIAAAPVPPATDPVPYPSGSVGYDVNWPQCLATGSTKTGTMPGPPSDPDGTAAFSIAILGVDGWAVGDENTCLAAEVTWAEKATVTGSKTPPPYELYLFLNSPASTSTIDLTGPAGTCASLAASEQPSCLAYNYGYNAAVGALSYATAKGASASVWWLDIENDSCAPGEWNDAAAGEWWSCDQSLNDQTIQGALDALRAKKLTAGVYSTAVQWKGITGGYRPTGGELPLWIAGAPWTSPPYPASDGYESTAALGPWCDGSYSFAGGTADLLQETPGSNGYPFDPDYAC